jgi:hypothetical protein
VNSGDSKGRIWELTLSRHWPLHPRLSLQKFLIHRVL